MWQCGKGSFKIPLAINPEGCDISANKIAPTLSAMTLKRLKSISLEYAEAPAIISFGCSLVASLEFCHNSKHRFLFQPHKKRGRTNVQKN